MRRFKDRNGGEWTLDLTIGAVSRVASESGGRLNLFYPHSPPGEKGEPTAENPSLEQQLYEDFLLLWELLCFLCSPELDSRGITPAQFGELMAADCLVDARRLLWEEWADFFRRLGNSPVAMTLDKRQVQMRRAMELATARVKELEPRIDAMLERKMTAALNDSFGKLAESLE